VTLKHVGQGKTLDCQFCGKIFPAKHHNDQDLYCPTAYLVFYFIQNVQGHSKSRSTLGHVLHKQVLCGTYAV